MKESTLYNDALLKLATETNKPLNKPLLLNVAMKSMGEKTINTNCRLADSNESDERKALVTASQLTLMPAYLKRKQEWLDKAQTISDKFLVLIRQMLEDFEVKYLAQKEDYTPYEISKILKNISVSMGSLLDRMAYVEGKTKVIDEKMQNATQINIFGNMTDDELRKVIAVGKEMAGLTSKRKVIDISLENENENGNSAV